MMMFCSPPESKKGKKKKKSKGIENGPVDPNDEVDGDASQNTAVSITYLSSFHQPTGDHKVTSKSLRTVVQPFLCDAGTCEMTLQRSQRSRSVFAL